jgi:hypothetical protein
MTLGVGIAESQRIQLGWANPYEGKDNTQRLKPGYFPGDLGWDPLGIKPEDPAELRKMQERELSHGRLAMFAAAGFLAQETVTQLPWAATLAVSGRNAPPPSIAALAVSGETKADLEALSKKLNPIVGYYDPLNLAEAQFWDTSNEATIGFLRHAEIKHGRVAMAAFVGYCVHANGIHFPWKVPGDELCAPGVSPPELWQNIPIEAKAQIILTIGIFEFYSEAAVAKSPALGGHYMSGGKPGFFPPFNPPKGVGTNGCYADVDGNPLLPHPVPLNLYDPFGFSNKKSEEAKARGLQIEINNGRLAMIGIMGFLSEGAVPGSVPALKGLIPATGEINVMSPLDFTKPLFG